MGVTLIIQEREVMPRYEIFDSIQDAHVRIRALREDDDFFGSAYLDGTRLLVKDTSLEEIVFINKRAREDVTVLRGESSRPTRLSAPEVRPPLLPPGAASRPLQGIDPFDLDAVTRAARESVTMMLNTQRKCSELVLKAGEDAQAVVSRAIKQSLETGAVAQANARKAVQDTIVSRAEMLSVLDTERTLQIAQSARLRAHARNQEEAAVVAATRGAPAQTNALAKVGARAWDYWRK